MTVRASAPARRESRTGPAHARQPVTVTAIVVAHNGARWLPEVVAALRTQTRPADRVVAVDTGSRDDTGDLLRRELGVDAVQTLDKRTGFGAALAAAVGVVSGGPGGPGGPSDIGADIDDGADTDVADTASRQHQQRSHWLWLLHDDCAPTPNALEALLATATSAPDVGVVGPKVRDWTNRRLLVETGVTISRSGHRETGLERIEEDQGQHDDVGDVLAVGSAGMLVRRDVWDRLDGFDPMLPLFRDDVDLGWRANLAGYRVVVATDAVVHHVQAATSGRRTIDSATRRRHLLDRRSALYVLLANLPARSLPWAYVRLSLASVLRAVGFALGKLPGPAADEIAAAFTVIGRPDRIVRARRARRPLRVAAEQTVAALLSPRRAQLARARDAAASVFSPTSHGSADIAAHGHRAVETGPGADEMTDLEPPRLRWARVLLRPGVLLTAALVVVTLVATRDLLGAGRLLDGALLPAPDGASDLWRTYAASWHDVGLGSGELAPPYLAVVAVVATLLLGNAPLAVDLLLLGSVPLAGLTAWVGSRGLLASPVLRAWTAAAYALLPATTGAIAAGRLGTAVAIVVAPLVAYAASRAVGDGRAGGSWPAAWASGMALAVAAAFVPMAYAIAVVLVGLVAITRARSVGVWVRLAVIAAVPPLLLVPWSLQVPSRPGLLLLEAGLAGPTLSDASLSPTWVLLGSAGGPGGLPWWLGIPLVVGALGGLMSTHRRGTVLAGWAVAAVGATAGIASSLTTLSTDTSPTPAAGWPGLAVAVTAAGLLVATVVGAERARDRLAERSFGWRQPVTVGLVALSAVVPLLFAGWWALRGADDPLARRDQVVLPEFVAVEGVEPTRPRTIVLRRGADDTDDAGDTVAYALLRDTGPVLGDAETGPPAGAYDLLDRAVVDLVSGRGGDQVRVLADHAVQFVLVAAPVDEDLVATIDSVAGLQRLSTSDGAALWRLAETAARLRLVAADGATLAALPAEPEGARADVPPGPDGRMLVLAERADEHWRATLDGASLPAIEAGWAQAFAVPADGGELMLSYEGDDRDRWLVAQLVLTGVVGVLALPGLRREAVGR